MPNTSLWEHIDSNAVKRIADETIFKSKNSAIPKDFRLFWNINKSNSPKEIKLMLNDEYFNATLSFTRTENPLTNIR